MSVNCVRYNPLSLRSGQVMIDLDGPGPVPPSLVTCELEAGQKVADKAKL